MQQSTPPATEIGTFEPTHADGNGISNGTGSRPSQGSLMGRLLAARYWIGLVVLLTGGTIALFYVTKPVLYGSTVILYMVETSGRSSDGSATIPDRSPRLDHLQYVATSTEMLEHLIKTFELYTHYDIDTLQPLYHERMCGELADNITVHVMDPNAMSITVNDRDRSYAALLANNMFIELQAMTERHALAYSQRVAAFYRQVIQATEQQAGQQVAGLMDLAARLKTETGGNLKGDNGAAREVLDLRLADMLSHVTSANQRLLELGKELEISTELLQKENLPNVTLIQRGMEDMRTIPWLKTLGAICSGMLIALVLTCSGLILWFKHGHELIEYFKEPVVAPVQP